MAHMSSTRICDLGGCRNKKGPEATSNSITHREWHCCLVFLASELISRLPRTVGGEPLHLVRAHARAIVISRSLVCGPLLGHCDGEIMAIKGLRAPGNYSGPFSNCVWERQKLFIFMMSGLWDMSPAPQTIYVHVCRNIGILSKPIDFVNLKNGTPNFCRCWKRLHRKLPKVRLMRSWRSWIWDQYLPEKMKMW